MEEVLIGCDLETHDSLLKTHGYSWKYNQGEILVASLYHKGVFFHDFASWEHILQNEFYTLIGAHIQYDLGWILHSLGMPIESVKCKIIDVLIAEKFIDEFSSPSLDKLANKYCNMGKEKDEVEEYVRKLGLKGDFRKHLKEVPKELLYKYVDQDAYLPVMIWEKQKEVLIAEKVYERCLMEFDCILPTLAMTLYGLPFDVKAWRKAREDLLFLQKEVEKKLPVDVNFSSGKQIGEYCDKENIEYNWKVTIKEAEFFDAKRVFPSVKKEKDTLVLMCSSKDKEKVVNLLENSGFTYTINPSFTTEYLLGQKERSEVLGLIGEYRISESILERTLNSSFLKFLCFDGKIHPQFSQVGTKTMRYTSNFPNIQQVPSRGGYSNFLFAERIRSLFDTDDEHVFLKIDYGQIEYRLICHIAPGKAGEEVRKQYEKNPNLDFHAYTQEMTGLDRKTAKNMSFGISFGLGLDGMCEMYGWSKEKGKEIAEQYHSKMPFVQPAFDFVKQIQSQYKYIYTIGGAKARLEKKEYAYRALNRFTQGSGADCIKKAIAQSWKEGVFQRLRISSQIHDELISPYVEISKQGIKDAFRLAEIMREGFPKLRVPLEAEPEFGTNWNNTKTIDKWKQTPVEEIPEKIKKLLSFV